MYFEKHLAFKISTVVFDNFSLSF